ncbi:MAG TPA: hypothetical protein V6D20_01255 [Candidatus Obscuribacterales bacterium]
MKTLYTKNPDKNCYEVEPGIYGRPCHTAEQSRLRKLGWSHNLNSLRGATDGIRQDEEEGQEEVEVTDENLCMEDRIYLELAEEFRVKFGKPPHHKMKADTIRKKLDESDD